MILAPVIPNGWPSAIAPPWVLSFSSGMSHSSMIGITWAANASFSSTTSMSSIVMPVCERTFLMAPIGATPMYSGSLPLVAATGDVLEPEDVAAVVVDALRAETFLILPHPEVLEFFRRKGADYDRWLRGMRRLQASVTGG